MPSVTPMASGTWNVQMTAHSASMPPTARMAIPRWSRHGSNVHSIAPNPGPAPSLTNNGWMWLTRGRLRRSCVRPLHVLRVVGAREQLLERAGVTGLDAHHPALAVGLAVHDRRVVGERVVHLDHLARDRGIEVAHGL